MKQPIFQEMYSRTSFDESGDNQANIHRIKYVSIYQN